jgi:hypothetical protein
MNRSRSSWLLIGPALLLISCAGSQAPADGIPTRVEFVCGADGSMTLSSSTVRAEPDGVHLDVVNGFDEPVSVEGFDVDPGRSTWVVTNGPGTMELMCWPFSQHGSGAAPPRTSLEIVDPQRLYVDGSVGCEIESSTTVDLSEEPVDEGPPSAAVARDVIDGLRPDDILRLAGYPEQDEADFVVVRNGDVVAAYGIARFAGQPWTIVSGTACDGSGLPLAGERIG